MAAPTVTEVLDAAVEALGGTRRPGQVRMAEAVAAAMSSGDHLLVQAGTGTGKSLAYLVPAVLHGDRVVVATATIALQAQVVDRDLPRLVDAVAPLLGRRPSFAMVKGRRNYLCQHKVAGNIPDDDGEALFAPTPTTPLGRDVLRLRDWADETDTGDRDELVPGVSERAWSQVSVSAHECLGRVRCPAGETCFAERARDAAARADIVVTNHALLAIDAFEGRFSLPEHDVVVVDEGHELVDRVTAVITDELTPSMVERAVRRSRKYVTDVTADALETAGEALMAALATVPPGRIDVVPEALRAALSLVRDSARAMASGLKPASAEDNDAGRQGARAAVDEVFDAAERMGEGRDLDVLWVAEELRRGLVLRVAPMTVGGLLRTRLFEERTVVMTSATLELGGSFDVIARQVGLGDPKGPTWEGIDVGSPFDYPRQGILYVASSLPAPGRDGTHEAVLDELAELMTAAGGRTLGLFSSMRAAEAATEAMRERLDLPILCQGEDQTAELVRQFAADARTCLFGTLSLWQGVDVPGSACQLVVIDRIPFPRPDDPLSSARQDAVTASGGNGFMTIAASHAALRLAQGAGRLIRTAEDRGVVAVLDSRLATARYGTFLRRSLPPFWATTDGDVVRRSLAAIDASAPPVLPVAERVSRSVGALGAPVSVVPESIAPSPRTTVVLGKAWSENDDAALRAAVEAGAGEAALGDQFGATLDQLRAHLAGLGLQVQEETLL